MMRSAGRPIALTIALALAAASAAHAQGRGGPSWSTTGSDAQRTSWVKTDPRISSDSMRKPGFQLLWKAKLENQPRQLESLTQPMLLPNIISYKGFKALAFVGGSSDNVYSIDYDLNKMFWKRHLNTMPAGPGTIACPGAMTTITRATPLGQTTPPAGRGGPAPAPGGRWRWPRWKHQRLRHLERRSPAHAESADRRRHDAAGQAAAAQREGRRIDSDRHHHVCGDARRLRLGGKRRVRHRPRERRENGDALGVERRKRRGNRGRHVRDRRQHLRGD